MGDLVSGRSVWLLSVRDSFIMMQVPVDRPMDVPIVLVCCVIFVEINPSEQPNECGSSKHALLNCSCFDALA